MNSLNAQAHSRAHTFVPAIGKIMIVDLPGERTRATIREIFNDDIVIVELTAIITQGGKSHFYRKGQIVSAKRTRNSFEEIWEVLEESELRQLENANKLAEEAAKPVIAAEPEPVDAAATRIEQRSKEREHPRTRGERKAATASRGNRSGQRKASSKG